MTYGCEVGRSVAQPRMARRPSLHLPEALPLENKSGLIPLQATISLRSRRYTYLSITRKNTGRKMGQWKDYQQANVNRSIRTIKAELEYLCDCAVISPQDLSDLLSRIPPQTQLHAPLSVGAVPNATPIQNPMSNLNLRDTHTNGSFNEKQEQSAPYQPAPSPQPPPAYNNAPPPQPQWPALAQATALYQYTSTDAGDLELQPNDHITVTEYMNAEWWKGRSSRTGQEGIFPRSYVKVIEEKAVPGQETTGNNYGNMPLETSGMGNGTGEAPSKFNQQGKKFGKKLGNAAIFGAGATIGSYIVNAIL